MPELMKLMRWQTGVLVVVAGSLAAGSAAMAQDASLQKVLSQMDAAAAKFQDAQADFSADIYTAVVQDHQLQKGTSAFRRANGAMEVMMHIAGDGSSSGERYILYKNGELDLYEPALKQETVIAAGANRAQVDSMMATGFGASGKDLTTAWTVTFQGMETVGGKQTARLDLVPKQENVRNNVSHATIWVDLSRDVSLKQIFYQPSGDSKTVTYSNIRYNTHLPASLFTLHVPRGTQVQHK